MKKFLSLIAFFMFLSIPSFARPTRGVPAIFDAVRGHDVKRVRALIKAGANVNQMYKGFSLLNEACAKNTEIVTLLLDTPGINVKKIALGWTTYYGNHKATPLMVYVNTCHRDPNIKDIVRLIKMGVNINYHSEYATRGTALWLAAFNYQPEVAIAILENAGPELNVNYNGAIGILKTKRTPLRSAVCNQNPEVVRLLLKRGAWVEDVRMPHTHYKAGLVAATIRHKNHKVLDLLMKYGANKYGPTSRSVAPLNLAMVRPSYDKWAEYFITKYKVDVNYRGKAGSPGDTLPILCAAGKNNVAGLKVLVKHGADINLANSKGVNAIQKASLHNGIDAVKYLIKQGVKLNGYGSADHYNAICYAVIKNNLKVLKLLVKNGADINAVTKKVLWGGPLAMVAMRFNPHKKKIRRRTLKKLLKLGANPNVLHAQNMTALMCAAQISLPVYHSEIVDNCEILIDNGADVNLVTTTGVTALMIAAGAGNIKLVKLLIKSGAKVNVVNKMNESVLIYAKKAANNKSKIINILKKAGAKNIVKRKEPTSVPRRLVGTWRGYQTDNKYWMATFIIKRNNTYSYSAYYKRRGRIVGRFSYKGKILAWANSYTLIPEIPKGHAPSSYMYKIVRGRLVRNNGRPLYKVR